MICSFYPKMDLKAIEINKNAVKILSEFLGEKNIFNYKDSH